MALSQEQINEIIARSKEYLELDPRSKTNSIAPSLSRSTTMSSGGSHKPRDGRSRTKSNSKAGFRAPVRTNTPRARSDSPDTSKTGATNDASALGLSATLAPDAAHTLLTNRKMRQDNNILPQPLRKPTVADRIQKEKFESPDKASTAADLLGNDDSASDGDSLAHSPPGKDVPGIIPPQYQPYNDFLQGDAKQPNAEHPYANSLQDDYSSNEPKENVPVPRNPYYFYGVPPTHYKKFYDSSYEDSRDDDLPLPGDSQNVFGGGSYHYGVPPAGYQKFHDSRTESGEDVHFEPYESGEYIHYGPYQGQKDQPRRHIRQSPMMPNILPPVRDSGSKRDLASPKGSELKPTKRHHDSGYAASPWHMAPETVDYSPVKDSRRMRPSNEKSNGRAETVDMQRQPMPEIHDERPTYIKIHTRYLLPETVDAYRLPWMYDPTDAGYIIIKEYLDHELTNELFEHSKRLMVRKEKDTRNRSPAIDQTIFSYRCYSPREKLSMKDQLLKDAAERSRQEG